MARAGGDSTRQWMSARPHVHGYVAAEGTRRHSRLWVQGRGRGGLHAPRGYQRVLPSAATPYGPRRLTRWGLSGRKAHRWGCPTAKVPLQFLTHFPTLRGLRCPGIQIAAGDAATTPQSSTPRLSWPRNQNPRRNRKPSSRISRPRPGSREAPGISRARCPAPAPVRALGDRPAGGIESPASFIRTEALPTNSGRRGAVPGNPGPGR